MRIAKSSYVVAFFAILVSLFLVAQYFAGEVKGVDFVKQKLDEMSLSDFWYVVLYVHIVGSMAAMVLGWTQFVRKWRTKSPRVHRTIGKIYASGVLLGSLSGAYLAFYATGGPVSSAGFLLLAIAWLYTMLRGVSAIAAHGDRAAHRKWMTRNYALTFAAVMLRLYVPISLVIFGEDSFNDYYRVIAWLCWIPNLLFAEWLIRRGAAKINRRSNSAGRSSTVS
ncbi:DUF2306 domain-containing protein [Cohnella suwonensis]|uniref:DUF2306 domain-containing protein n=1 Tax=Cohnella suwonensis TaxID=696072 RepID=A0ABW0LZ53_9BACL